MTNHRFRVLATLAALTLLAASCSGSDGSEDTGDTGVDGSTQQADEELTEAELTTLAEGVEGPGPWAVGTTTTEVTGARERTLPVQVWYPVDPSVATTATPASYDFPGLEVPAGAVTGVPPATGDFPLVIYSHGNGGLRYVSSFLTEHLASHGFVVMAPDHVGNTALDNFLGTGDDSTRVALDRPIDVSAVIDGAIVGAPGLDEVVAVTDTESIAVIGHSFGGYTALALAGGVGDAPADDRVDAIVGLAAASSGLEDDSLSAVNIPTLLLSGTLDETTPIEEDTERPAELIEGRPLVRADLEGAGHQSFSNVCDYQELTLTRTDLPAALIEAIDEYAIEGCSEELLDIDEAHRVVRRLTTSFLQESLREDSDYVVLTRESAAAGQPLAILNRTD